MEGPARPERPAWPGRAGQPAPAQCPGGCHRVAADGRTGRPPPGRACRRRRPGSLGGDDAPGYEEPDRQNVLSPKRMPVPPTTGSAESERTEPGRTDPAVIRNFCIIAHIDHGKSTLADRMLQLTGVVAGRNMRAQYLDRMDIERERGITIKSQAVRLPWTGEDGREYVLNLIDTPGHVDFSYEVSRSLAACEGAVLLVDAAQGIEAQTLANLYMALEADLQIIPVLNKIDLPAAQPGRYAEEIANIIGCDPGDVLRVSAKTGEGVRELLHAIVARFPAPAGDPAGAVPRADLRLGVRHLPRRRHVRAGGRRAAVQARAQHDDVDRRRPRDARGRRDLPGAPAVRRPRRRRGRLPHHRRQGRPAGAGRRHGDRGRPRGHRAPARIRPPARDGVLRPLPGGRRRLPGTARGARPAAAERRRADLRAGDLGGPGLRLPVRFPRAAAHGDRPRAAGAGVRPGADLHRARTSSTASSWSPGSS